MLVGVPKVWHIQTPVPGILQRGLWGLGPRCLLLQPPSTPHTQQQHSVLHLGGCVHIFTFYTLSTVVFSASWVHISPLQPGSEATGCVRVVPESLTSCRSCGTDWLTEHWGGSGVALFVQELCRGPGFALWKRWLINSHNLPLSMVVYIQKSLTISSQFCNYEAYDGRNKQLYFFY